MYFLSNIDNLSFNIYNAQRNGEPHSGESGGHRPRIAAPCYVFSLESARLRYISRVEPGLLGLAVVLSKLRETITYDV